MSFTDYELIKFSKKSKKNEKKRKEKKEKKEIKVNGKNILHCKRLYLVLY